LKDKGLKTVMFTGGEPTLHPDFHDIILFCKQNLLHVKIATNGSNMESLYSLIQKNLLDEIVISVDAVIPETYRTIRGKDCLSQIYDFIESYTQFANRIHLSFLIQRKNYKEILPFLNRSKTLNVAKVALLVPHHNGDFTSLVDQQEYKDLMFLSNRETEEFKNVIAPQLKSFYSENPQMFKCSEKHIEALVEYICKPDALYNFRTSICSFPLKSLFLYADGYVSLCPYYSSWKMNEDSLFKNLTELRMKCILKGKEKEGYCRRCLEVPL
jgi:molybdenum cofactor biosynthesis enzyme MoaA